MLISLEMLRAGHTLPKIPKPIPIICRPKTKKMREIEAKGEIGEMEEKEAKEEKGTNLENKSLARGSNRLWYNQFKPVYRLKPNIL